LINSKNQNAQNGMNILRSNLFDKESRKRAFLLLKKAADKENDIEAYWRVAACYSIEIGIQKDRKTARIYAQKAMDSGSVDGIFWFGYSQENEENEIVYYQQASEQGHLAGFFLLDCVNFMVGE
jgi:TPR repeat protein